MKNQFNKIEECLKVGLNVVVRDIEENAYCVISPIKDIYNGYVYGYWTEEIEEAKKSLCYYNREDDDDGWNDLDLEIVETYRLEYEPFKEGQKVRILDSVKRTDNWTNAVGYPDMTGIIENIENGISGIYYWVNCKDNRSFYISHQYLAPLLEEEPKELITIGDHSYDKKQVEEALKNIKAVK